MASIAMIRISFPFEPRIGALLIGAWPALACAAPFAISLRFLKLTTLVAILLQSSSALALSPELRIGQLYHTSWTANDGAPTGIESVAQTSDGYVWLAASAGLFRFDGIRFERIDR